MDSFLWKQPSGPIFDKDGRIQPLNCKKGEVANRIITVGDPNRANKFKECFDKDSPVIIRQSNMIYATYTGKFHGVPVSVIATGMGFAMVEMLLVQIRAIVDGPIYIIRFGTCGSLHADVPVGCFALTNKAYAVRQSYENDAFPYEITKKPIDLDAGLIKLIHDEFTQKMPQYRTVIGPDFSADTFYGSQGRLDDAFRNNNEKVIETILQVDPDALSFEMETYVLAFLANKFPAAQIKVGAVCITLAQRTSGDFLDNDRKYTMEREATTALLEILAKAE
ncbi:purine and uridine phosphorylase [Histomonas meleagridis]|uniref:purine and uridine phosphorylase n=1 Tax=Histomonas meleagridis TaxID=135588 RepID=UPI0035596B87|nr:purine and uridine phosphorylase [Histomonas meleagridis]KAH0802715.1 purine and uridine phosphorylase [Histomonas meleagridis]